MKKIIGVLLFLCVACGAWALTGQQLLTQAKTEPDPQAQIKLLTRAIAVSPKLADAYHYRADAYLALGRQKLALDDYSQTIKLRPNDPFRYYARGLAYMDMERYSLAVADLSKAISLKSTYRPFYLARARAYKQAEKYDLAIADYRQYLRGKTPQPDLVWEMMPVYLAAYRYDDGDRMLDLLEETGNNTADLFYWRGRILLGQSRLDEAVAAFSKAIHRDNTYAAAYRYRANAFKEIGDLEATLEDYDVLISLQPDALFFNRRGLVHEELQQFQEAEADYTRAVELNPKWAIPFNNRGFARMHLKNWEGAKQDLETAIKLDGATPTPYINLAGVYWLSKKDRKHAYQNLDKAVQRNFKDFKSLFDEDQKGWMFKGLNQTSEFRALLYK